MENEVINEIINEELNKTKNNINEFLNEQNNLDSIVELIGTQYNDYVKLESIGAFDYSKRKEEELENVKLDSTMSDSQKSTKKAEIESYYTRIEKMVSSFRNKSDRIVGQYIGTLHDIKEDIEVKLSQFDLSSEDILSISKYNTAIDEIGKLCSINYKKIENEDLEKYLLFDENKSDISPKALKKNISIINELRNKYPDSAFLKQAYSSYSNMVNGIIEKKQLELVTLKKNNLVSRFEAKAYKNSENLQEFIGAMLQIDKEAQELISNNRGISSQLIMLEEKINKLEVNSEEYLSVKKEIANLKEKQLNFVKQLTKITDTYTNRYHEIGNNKKTYKNKYSILYKLRKNTKDLEKLDIKENTQEEKKETENIQEIPSEEIIESVNETSSLNNTTQEDVDNNPKIEESIDIFEEVENVEEYERKMEIRRQNSIYENIRENNEGLKSNNTSEDKADFDLEEVEDLENFEEEMFVPGSQKKETNDDEEEIKLVSVNRKGRRNSSNRHRRHVNLNSISTPSMALSYLEYVVKKDGSINESELEKLNDAVDLIRNNNTYKMNIRMVRGVGSAVTRLKENVYDLSRIYEKESELDTLKDVLFDISSEEGTVDSIKNEITTFLGDIYTYDKDGKTPRICNGNISEYEIDRLSQTIDSFNDSIRESRLADEEIECFNKYIIQPLYIAMINENISNMGLFGSIRSKFRKNNTNPFQPVKNAIIRLNMAQSTQRSNNFMDGQGVYSEEEIIQNAIGHGEPEYKGHNIEGHQTI